MFTKTNIIRHRVNLRKMFPNSVPFVDASLEVEQEIDDRGLATNQSAEIRLIHEQVDCTKCTSILCSDERVIDSIMTCRNHFELGKVIYATMNSPTTDVESEQFRFRADMWTVDDEYSDDVDEAELFLMYLRKWMDDEFEQRRTMYKSFMPNA